ncbi:MULTISPECIES: potassium channel family protein [unclassified Campylobacter]|uniref:potassium channel family protein n=1 Tax=unclassified Campylobacter TaxID=2593542 RepID=UPI0022E9F9C9|nr:MULTISPECIES: potassium channel protein [unclassified Campylobacter]MBQ3675066.1 NAD-binding protein [Campylobacter sp.]MBQ9876331.1 NAD-binding protein [Campylobacter sp.]MBR0071038.1 NAD-binding protein [Campylobacter sp.]MDA3055729.1 NAD-binding protein [Campylobacter sp. CN_NA1]MDA3065007.1 NAD-binding protein [Campylobacter sp. CN_NE4]
MSFADKVKKFLNWSGSTKPDIDLNSEIYDQLKAFRLPLILIILMMLIGTLGYIFIAGFSLADAFYQAGMTFTTVGFTEVAPISNAGRIFTIVFILMGFGTFTFCLGVVVEVIQKGILLNLIRERNMINNIARLKNHFIICYDNIYSAELAKEFRANHIPFVVIDNNPNLAQIAEENSYPYFIIGEPHMENTLLKAHLSSAKCVITLSPNLADNIAIISVVRLYEKELGRTPYFIMTSADTQNDIEKLKKLGANSVVSPSKLAAQRLSAVSVRPDMENILERFLYQKDSPIDIEEIEIPEYSWIRFKRLKETKLREMTNADVVGIKEPNNKFTPMPNGDYLIGTGVKFLVIGTAEGIMATKKLINSKYKPQEMKYV